MSGSRIPQFYKMTIKERLQELVRRAAIVEEDLEAFSLEGGLASKIADTMIENVVGVFGLPLGVAANFVVDGESVLVPMVTEEPSIVAASSHIAKMVAISGGFQTQIDNAIMIGQIQILDVLDIDGACADIFRFKEEFIEKANGFCLNVKSRGGGCVDIIPRVLPAFAGELSDEKPMLVIHVLIDCLDAMGANIVNTVIEGLGPILSSRLNSRLGFQILSNFSDQRLAKAFCRIPYRLLSTDNSGDNGFEIAKKIVEGYLFAKRDIYRATTHNKGIMNGIDAVAIATGNDWRALEAGAHAYACRAGRYTPLTSYQLNSETKSLDCSIELPLSVGVVGGNTKIHPSVKVVLKLLGSFGKSAKKLSSLMAAVGLAQNLGALRALACEGIQQGHMALHHRKYENE